MLTLLGAVERFLSQSCLKKYSVRRVGVVVASEILLQGTICRLKAIASAPGNIDKAGIVHLHGIRAVVLVAAQKRGPKQLAAESSHHKSIGIPPR